MLEPSQQDITVTKRIAEAGELLGIELLDHIIVGNSYDESNINYLSMREEKYIS